MEEASGGGVIQEHRMDIEIITVFSSIVSDCNMFLNLSLLFVLSQCKFVYMIFVLNWDFHFFESHDIDTL